MKGSPVRVRASASPKALQMSRLHEEVETGLSDKSRCGQVVGRFGCSCWPDRVINYGGAAKSERDRVEQPRIRCRLRLTPSESATDINPHRWRSGLEASVHAVSGALVGF